MKKIDILKALVPELERFRMKLALAIKEQDVDVSYSSANYAAAKRSALDLKRELTKLTQDSKTIYGTGN